MSDNSQPVSSRRALREKRRAEMEALLANSKAEQDAKELADQKNTGESEKSAKPAKTEASPEAKPEAVKPKASQPEAKAEAKPAASPKPSTPAAKPAVKPSTPATQATAKPAPAAAPKPAQKPAAAAKQPSAPKPVPAKQDEAKVTPAASASKPADKPVVAPAKPAPQSQAKPATPAPSKPEQPKNDSSKARPQAAASAKPDASEESAEAENTPEGSTGERASLRRARNREALRERRRLEGEVDALTSHIPTVEPGDDPKPLTRRQLRLQALAEQGQAAPATSPKPVTKPAKKPADHDDSPETTVMSVEQALAARRAHAPKTPIDPNLLGEDDSEIDLEVLAHQREMAARAAIISRRAAERERLRVENAKQGKDDKSSDPFTGAMGNIREVEDRIAKTGVQGPKTQSVSLNLDADGKISSKTNSKTNQAAPAAKKPAGKSGVTAKPAPKQTAMPAPKPAAKPEAKSVAKPAAQPAAKPAAKPADKSAVEQKKATPAGDSAAVQMPRINAVNAQGLEPLDVQTHGVRRANNMLIAMIVALSLGGAALIAGLIMLLGN